MRLIFRLSSKYCFLLHCKYIDINKTSTAAKVLTDDKLIKATLCKR